LSEWPEEQSNIQIRTPEGAAKIGDFGKVRGIVEGEEGPE
jgi:hypothetical protein